MDTKLTDLCFVKNDFLTKEECVSFIDYYETSTEETLYENSLDVNDRTHKNSTFSVKEINNKSKLYFFVKNKIRQALIEYQKYLDSLGVYNVLVGDYAQYSHAYRILKYEKGSQIHPHLDHNVGNYLTLTFNLNNNYEGGKFSFFNKKFQPELGEGTLMIFPADIFWSHEVTEVIQGNRYSFNCFLGSLPREIIVKLLENSFVQHQKYLNQVNPDEILGPYFPERLSIKNDS